MTPHKDPYGEGLTGIHSVVFPTLADRYQAVNPCVLGAALLMETTLRPVAQQCKGLIGGKVTLRWSMA